jgi:hypothetical protein
MLSFDLQVVNFLALKVTLSLSINQLPMPHRTNFTKLYKTLASLMQFSRLRIYLCMLGA